MKKKGDLNRKTVAIILQTLNESGEPLHVREVIRRCGLCHETVVRVLKTLAERGILETFKDKNKQYYSLPKNTSTEQIIKIFTLMKGGREEKEPAAREFHDFESLMCFCAGIFNSFSSYFRAFDEIWQKYLYFHSTIKAIKEFKKTSKKMMTFINYAFSFYEKHKEKIEFLRGEFLSEGIDIFNIEVSALMKVITWFTKNEKAYRDLRIKGLKPSAALEWAREYKWIGVRMAWKTTPMGEWDKEIRRLLEHSPKVLRNGYGWRLTYKEILGLKN